MDFVARIEQAFERIRPHAYYTPVMGAKNMCPGLGAELALKCENMQHTGSFKLRGALNKVLTAQEQGAPLEFMTASTGNHGAAVTFATQLVGGSVTVYVPDDASGGKVAKVQAMGARLIRHGSDCIEAEAQARQHAADAGMAYISPYNDWDVAAGQGTVALEVLQQVEGLEAVFVAVGGGGLISGIAAYMKAKAPHIQVIGCSPEASAVMIHSVRAGKILDLPSDPTLSDATAGGVEANSITFPMVSELVDRFVLVPEQETRDMLRHFLQTQQMLIEGAAAMALAACKMHAADFPQGKVAVILCGGNIDIPVLKTVLVT